MTQLTLKQLYDAYAGSELLPLEITDATTLKDIEAEKEKLGDTLFLFLARELCGDPAEDMEELADRCHSAIRQIEGVRTAIEDLESLEQCTATADGGRLACDAKPA